MINPQVLLTDHDTNVVNSAKSFLNLLSIKKRHINTKLFILKQKTENMHFLNLDKVIIHNSHVFT